MVSGVILSAAFLTIRHFYRPINKKVKMKPQNLPYSSLLPVEHLSAVFSNVTNSYKYYWFLAILEFVKKGRQKIDIHDLIMEMIGEVWYPINYFRLSFGKWDSFDQAAQNIQQILGCSKEIKKQELIELLNQNRNNQEIKELINKLRRFVPMRFLTPWFTNELRGMPDHKKNRTIIELAEKNFSNGKYAPYRFTDEQKSIEIDKEWFKYFNKHLNVLEGFSYWHLLNFLQKNNPNVPNIPVKLFPPESRNFNNATKFWNLYFDMKEHVYCIYTGNELTRESYSLDHFLPWSFVGHDQLWNLIPTLNEVNSSKSDQLPAQKYLDHFTQLQYDAFHTAIGNQSVSKKLLEDYTILFKKNLREIAQMNTHHFSKKLKDVIHPQMQVAVNMGFGKGWFYS
jgi:hypothetical protein